MIALGSFRMGLTDEVASSIYYGFRYSPATGRYEEQSLFRDTTQRRALGKEIHIQKDMPYQYEPSSAARVIRDKAFFMREQRTQVVLDADPQLYLDVTIGQDVRLTHFAGLGEDGFRLDLFSCDRVRIKSRQCRDARRSSTC